jgi:hypothetical protein
MRAALAMLITFWILRAPYARTAAADGDDEPEAWSEADELAEMEAEGPSPPRAHVSGPPIGQVLAAAYAAAGLDRDPGRGLARRARLAGLVPWVSVRTGRDASWRDDDPDVGRGTTLEVRATWRLDRLMFEPRELQVVSLEAARRRERRHLAAHVIETYFAWRRAAGEPLPGGRRSASRAAQAAAELDALTDRWFSEAVEASRRASSARRIDDGPTLTP